MPYRRDGLIHPMNSHNKNNKANNYLWGIVVVFFLVTVSFILDLWGAKKQVGENPLIDLNSISTVSVRDPLNSPQLQRAGFTYTCDECHGIIEPSLKQEQSVRAHTDIQLEHGINDRCLNCHHSAKREMLVDIYGNEIPFERNELLCLKCHGLKYRDWAAGVHGRSNGYWDETLGESVMVRCTGCHDPHSPKFKPLNPLPAPIQDNYRWIRDTGHE